eukprot:719481-Amphidinium_carterae.1
MVWSAKYDDFYFNERGQTALTHRYIICEECFGPNQNASDAIHLLFADDIFVLTTSWHRALSQLSVIRSRLVSEHCQMDIAIPKTEIICMSGPLTTPNGVDWGGMKVGGPVTVMVVLGAEFTLNQSLQHCNRDYKKPLLPGICTRRFLRNLLFSFKSVLQRLPRFASLPYLGVGGTASSRQYHTVESLCGF